MKNKLLMAMIVAGAAMTSQFAAATDGTITFNGKLTAETCTITTGANGNFTVNLPTVSTSQLQTALQTAGRTPFSIALTGCGGGSETTVHTFFETGGNTDAVTGNLKVSGGATNVEIGLLNGDQSNILLGLTDAAQMSKPANIVAGAATLNYFAQYQSTGAASAGAANSSVLYTLAYQ